MCWLLTICDECVSFSRDEETGPKHVIQGFNQVNNSGTTNCQGCLLSDECNNSNITILPDSSLVAFGADIFWLLHLIIYEG